MADPMTYVNFSNHGVTSNAGSGPPTIRTLCHNSRRLNPSRHDPYHATPPNPKYLVMNPNFPDGFLALTDQLN